MGDTKLVAVATCGLVPQKLSGNETENAYAAVSFVEQEFECVVPESALSNCTFGEFVAAVMKARSKGNGNL